MNTPTESHVCMLKPELKRQWVADFEVFVEKLALNRVVHSRAKVKGHSHLSLTPNFSWVQLLAFALNRFNGFPNGLVLTRACADQPETSEFSFQGRSSRLQKRRQAGRTPYASRVILLVTLA